MHELPPSALVVEQRIRNRLIEYLESVVSYQLDPPAYDMNELLNQWNDWAPDPVTFSVFPSPAYSTLEAESLLSVGLKWNALCDATPKSLSDELAVLQTLEWREFCAAAQSALCVLKLRGRLSESQEVLK